MARVLHLASNPPNLAATYAMKMAGHATRTLGRGGDYRNLAQAAFDMRRSREAFDLIHAWDDSALAAARLARTPVVWSPQFARIPGWLHHGPSRNVHAACLSESMRQSLLRAGFPEARCHRVEPMRVGNTLPADRDWNLRRELGLSDSDFALLAPGESNRFARHSLAVHATSILHVLSEKYRVLLWGRGRLAETADLGPKLRQPRLVVRAEHQLRRSISFESLLRVADAGFYTALAGADPLPLLLMRSAGLPVIAAADSGADEFARCDAGIRVVPAAPRMLAQSALSLAESPGVGVPLENFSIDYEPLYQLLTTKARRHEEVIRNG